MEFEKVVMIFTMQEPYYGILLSSMDRIPSNATPTLAVGRKGNVFKLYYNPDFVEKLNIDTLCQLLKHEVLHVAFNHFSIWNGEEAGDDKPTSFLRNVAADLEINGYLDRNKIQKEAGGVFVEDFGWERYEGTREYFRKLIKKSQPDKQQANANQPSKPCNGGQGGQGGQSQQSQAGESSDSQSQTSESEGSGTQPKAKKRNKKSGSSQGGQGSPVKSEEEQTEELQEEYHTFDDHSQWPQMKEDEAEILAEVIDDMLVMAAEECEKGRGTIPSELKIKIDGIRNRKKPKPVADWKRYFRRYLGHEFTEFIRKSKKRLSRRFPDAAGNRHRRKSHILVAIDTSGSVSMPEYREFFGQLRTLNPTATFHVVECDTEIHHEYDFRLRANETLHGGGGTSFQPPVDLFLKNRKIYDALVYFTDGWAPIPHNTPKDTLWVISSQGDQQDRKKYQVNGASVAFIKPQQ